MQVRFFIAIVVFCFFIVTGSSQDLITQLVPELFEKISSIDKLTPGLLNQLENIAKEKMLLSQIDISKSLNNFLKQYQNYEKKTMFISDLSTIVQSDFFNSYQKGLKSTFVVDGILNEWENLPYQSIDVKGDSFKNLSTYDVVEAGAFYQPDGNFYFAMTMMAPPAHDQTLQFVIDCVGNNDMDFVVFVFYGNDGRLYGRYQFLPGGTSGDMPADSFNIKNNIIEARINLQSFFANDKIKSYLKVVPSSVSWTQNFYEASPELLVPKFSVNYSLFLYLYMLENGLYITEDSITAAIAIVNSYLFSIGNKDVKIRILEDIEAHFGFYKTIIAYQKEIHFPFALSDCPLVPKIHWADRYSYNYFEINSQIDKAGTGCLSQLVYEEFVDKIETLISLHALVKENNLMSRSISTSTESIENFVHAHRVYRSSMENLELFNKSGIFSDEDLILAKSQYEKGEYFVQLFGEKRRWDELRWMNFQLSLFKKNGFFQGDCGDTTVVQMGFFRAAGIATVSLQWMSEDRDPRLSHNFPGYYDNNFGRWFSNQKPDYRNLPVLQAAVKTQYLYLTLPICNPMNLSVPIYDALNDAKIIDKHYPGELTTNSRIINLLTCGIPGNVFNQMQFLGTTQNQGFLFNDNNAPANLIDQDNDGIPFLLEKVSGTSDVKADSDGDGILDGQELSLYFDPLDVLSPGKSLWMISPLFEPSKDWSKSGLSFESSIMRDYKSTENLFKILFHAPDNFVFVHNLTTRIDPATSLENQSIQYRSGKNWVMLVDPVQTGTYFLNIFQQKDKNYIYLGRFRLEVLQKLNRDIMPETELIASEPYYSQDFFDYGFAWQEPFAGKFRLKSGNPFTLKIKMPEKLIPYIALMNFQDKEIKNFVETKLDGGYAVITVTPPGVGWYKLHFSFSDGKIWRYGSSLYFESTACPIYNSDPGIIVQGPYMTLDQAFYKYQLSVVTLNRGYFITDGREVKIQFKVPTNLNFWFNLFDQAEKSLEGFSYMYREGEIVTIILKPNLKGKYFVNFGVIADKSQALWCGRFDFEVSASAATEYVGKNIVIYPYPILENNFFLNNLRLLPKTFGGLKINTLPGEISLIIPSNLEIGLSVRDDQENTFDQYASIKREQETAKLIFLPEKKGRYFIYLFIVKKNNWIWLAKFVMDY